MTNTFITHLQVFGIGFSFGLAGPCLLTCTPIVITYLAGRKKRFVESLIDLITFLTGRLAAYCLLGYAAGLSAILLNRFTHPKAALFFKPLAGVVSIVLGIIVLISKDTQGRECRQQENKIYNFGGLFVLGFALGVAPCAPLAALLFEIALMSKSAVEGASYALSFGLGTFVSGLFAIGALAGIVNWLPAKMLRRKSAFLIFKTACSALLVIFGIGLIWYRFR